MAQALFIYYTYGTGLQFTIYYCFWIPAFAGMTNVLKRIVGISLLNVCIRYSVGKIPPLTPFGWNGPREKVK